MASDESQFCTDEALLQELKKLGYNDVPAESFLKVKKDLFELMLQEKKVPINWQKYHELTSFKNMKYPDQSRNVKQPTAAFLPGRSPTFVVDPDKTSPVNYTSQITLPDMRQNSTENEVKNMTPSQNILVQEESKNSLPTSSRISGSSPSESQKLARNYKPRDKTQFLGSSKEKQPENFSLPSHSRILNASPKKYDFSSKEKTQRQKLFLEDNAENANFSPSSTASNASFQKFSFRKPQGQKQLIENPENINLPRSSSESNTSPQKFSVRKPPRREPLIEEDRENTNLPTSTSVPNASLNRNKYEDCRVKGWIRNKNCPEKIEKENRVSYPSSHELNSVQKEYGNSKVPSQSSISEEDQENTDAASDTSKSNESGGTSMSNVSFDEYRERLKTFKSGRESKSLGSPEEKDSSLVSLEGNKIKRKVLRHKNGKPVVTEEFIEIPSIFSTSLSSNSNASFSSNSSSSLSAASPETSDTPRSTDSLSSTRSVASRSTVAKKKSDPVAMYHYYKKFWNEHKPPGEKSHGKLRWAIRDRMLEYSL